MRWVPLSIPLERRMQTCGIVTALLLFPVFMVCIPGALLMWPPLVSLYSRELTAVYLVWLYLFDLRTPQRGGRPFSALRGLSIWRAAKDFFPATFHLPRGRLYEGGVYIFAVHPHGLLSLTTIANFVWNGDPVATLGVDYRVCTVSFNFIVPFWRDLILGMGFIDASKRSVLHLLRSGVSAMLVVGGAAEAVYAHPGSADLVLRRRTGFVRIALETGASLVPIYSFGENDLYEQASGPFARKFQRAAIRFLGFALPFFRGRGVFQYSFGLLPRRIPLHAVMGEPIKVPQIGRAHV